MELEIRPAGPADFDEVRELLVRSALSPAGLADSGIDVLVARDAGAVVGCAAVEHHGDYGLLRSVAVDPRSRDRGVGGALVAAAVAVASRRAFVSVYLLTESAQGFFARLGFVPVERAELPAPIRESDQVTHLCPSRAQAMRLARP